MGLAGLGQDFGDRRRQDVLPWSTWPIVPILQCGLLRLNFSLAICLSFHCDGRTQFAPMIRWRVYIVMRLAFGICLM